MVDCVMLLRVSRKRTKNWYLGHIWLKKPQQKSYADKRRRDLEFFVGDMVFMKVSSLKNVIRFIRKGKLAPRFIGFLPIVERIVKLAYKIDLPQKVAYVRNIFQVSCLWKFVHDSGMMITPDQLEDVKVDLEVFRSCRSLRIVVYNTKLLGRNSMKLVKV